ncbi:transcription factor TFIIIB component B'' homolog isoform X2 [Corythoichthys intestinalis]|uniref:transcription factor TFIIIB component B'' homolog isoform X2 n=1 Tax=Corythoichthys intestinalis TaxID=161448 RepID=UPI0025A64341|nr:transcription factor TFIIIB component B'' homolog isoform X2 [Corythoichthys intestinalis]
MFRRSRFSVRPNVGGAGRTAAPSQDAAPASQESKEVAKDLGKIAVASVVTDTKPVDVPLVEATNLSEGNDPNGDATNSSAALQRRKRFSVKPRLAPGRPAVLPRTPKSPAKVVPETPPKNSDLEAKTELQVPLSGVDSLTSPQPEPVVAPCDDSGSAAAVPTEHSPTEKTVSSDDAVIKVPPRPPDKAATLDKESAALSEKAKTLLSSRGKKSPGIARYSLSRLLNDPSDIQRLEKAQKLRDLLRQEMRKEKNAKKEKRKHVNEYSLESVDPTTMTMRDLIRYIPMSNTMSSSLEDSVQENENETEVPFSPKQISPHEPEVPLTTSGENGSQLQEEQEVEEEAVLEEGNEEALMAPRIKVAEDGTLILDEESLTVAVQRAKGPNPAESRDPIFERGSTTTYSSFRTSKYCKPWTNEETDMFFLAISMVGTDFTMIGQLFHNRTRAEIRNKFKKEERKNSWRIDKAFRERRKLDIEYFTKLLEKVLEFQANRKKLKSLVQKNAPKKRQRRSKRAEKHIDSEAESEEEMDDFLGSEREDGEKENDKLSMDGNVSKTKKKRKRQSAEDVSSAKLKRMTSDATEKSGEEEDVCILEDSEAALPEDQQDSEVTETDKSSERPSIQPAKLSRGRAAKPLPVLGRKWGKKLPNPPPATKTVDDESAKEDQGVTDEALKEQVNKDASPARTGSEEEEDDQDDGGDSSGDEVYSAKPAKPTRYGRVPKPRAILEYPTKEEESTHKPPRKCSAKRARTSTATSASSAPKKSKLITLRASQSDFSEDEEEHGLQKDDEVFVTTSLHSPSTVISQVDETIEELDILGNMSDVLDITQDGLCSYSFCEREKNETGAPEPCVHQLDLLVDVIDLVSSEHNQELELDSNNMAAETLLAIGNVSQSETAHDHGTEIALQSTKETSELLEEEIVAEFIEENCSSQIPFISEEQRVAQTFEMSTPAIANTDSSPQRDVSDPDPGLPAQSNPQMGKSNAFKVKPNPNLMSDSRTAPSNSQREQSPVASSEEKKVGGRHAVSETNSTDSEVVGSCRDNEKIFEGAVIESKAEDSKAPLDLGCGDNDSNLQKLKCQKSSEVASTHQTRRSRFPKVKPNIPETTRSQRSKPQNPIETCLSPNLETTCKVTAEIEPQAVSTSSLEASDQSNNAACAEVTEPFVEESKKALDEGGRDDAKAFLECQKSSEVKSTHQTRGSRFPKVKPKPNLQTSRNVHAKPLESTGKTTGEVESPPTGTTLQKESQTTSSASTIVPMLSTDTTVIPSEELIEQKMAKVGLAVEDTKHTNSERAEIDQNTETLSDTAVTEHKAKASNYVLDQECREHDNTLQVLPDCQNLRKVVKPNLTLISRSSLSKSQTTKEISSSENVASTSQTTEVKPQATGSSSPQKQNQSVSFASTVLPGLSASSIVIPSEELCSSEQKMAGVGLATGESKTTDSETVERVRNVEEPSNTTATEPIDEESSKILDQESRDHDSTMQELPENQRKVVPRRSRFPKVKPNLPKISRSSLSQSQPMKETCPSSDPESTSKTTIEVESQPTCTLSIQKQGQSISSLTLVPILTTSSIVIPSEELRPTEQKLTGTGLTAGVSKITDSKTVESGRNTEEPSDAEVREHQAEESNQVLEQDIGDHNSNLQELPKNLRNVVPRRSRFPKVKPNLPQIARISVSKSQTTKEISSSSDPELQPTCSFSVQTQSHSVDSSVVIPITNINSTPTPSDENTYSEKIEDHTPVTQADVVKNSHPVASPSTLETFQSVASVVIPSADGDLEKKDTDALKVSQTIQRRRRLTKVQPNLRPPGRAIQSKVGQDKPANVLPDCQSVSKDEASGQCASNEVDSLEKSKSTISEGQSNDMQTASKKTASNYSSCQDKDTATSPFNSTLNIHSSNSTLPDSVLESSGPSDANVVTEEAQPPKCTEATLLPKPTTMERRKVKPNLGQSTRQSCQTTVKVGSDACTSQEQTTVLRTPVEGADDQIKEASSMMTHPSQDGMASSAGPNQTSTSLSIFPDTTSVPSDPDEPFFILSLMEVPLEETSTQSPQTDQSVQHSVALDGTVAATDVSLPDVPSREMSVPTNALATAPIALAPPTGSEDTIKGASSPKRKPKGFLSFLTHPSNVTMSHRRKAASRQSSVSKPASRKKSAVPAAPARPAASRTQVEPEPLPTPCTRASRPLPGSSFSADEVIICNPENSVEVQDEPTDVSTYFLSDIFTEVKDT